ncbi:MAG: YbaB/EbfC family nucleoid-associated protein [Oscillospiraceae bacterium]|nr:YbaB/EbfC family nucleoid-associated protein [Oscillospiraceae bacterium]MBQ4256657.1 YbaB/EbfC family nucleoid-associated protein [Oscillospiraceae bacterium]MBQ9209527.1 YbaB/EbfC family nucleoid-associated protein [Oscillospiraceae bacterium]MBR4346023.1 YbaB/EbfC family nucleoid-associated protein [Oscillospiraceae bacterium]
MKARLPQGMGGQQSMQGMIRQAQKMQEQITEVQEQIEQETFSTTSGGGAVEITMTGKKHVESLKINKDVIGDAAEDPSILEDLIISAVNDCVAKIDEVSESRMGAITGGVSFPGLF